MQFLSQRDPIVVKFAALMTITAIAKAAFEIFKEPPTYVTNNYTTPEEPKAKPQPEVSL